MFGEKLGEKLGEMFGEMFGFGHFWPKKGQIRTFRRTFRCFETEHFAEHFVFETEHFAEHFKDRDAAWFFRNVRRNVRI